MIFLRTAWSLMGCPLRSISCEESVGGLIDRQLLPLVVRDEDVDDVDAVRDWVAQLPGHSANDGRGNVALEPVQTAVGPHLGRDRVGVVVSHLGLEIFHYGDEFGDDLLFVHEASAGKKFLPNVRRKSRPGYSRNFDSFGKVDRSGPASDRSMCLEPWNRPPGVSLPGRKMARRRPRFSVRGHGRSHLLRVEMNSRCQPCMIHLVLPDHHSSGERGHRGRNRDR